MNRWKNVINNTTLALNCLLLFLLIFDNSFFLPPWLQMLGRLHPLLVHFPIVILLFCSCWELAAKFSKNTIFNTSIIGDWLLLLSALAAAGSALMGLFLSKENGYQQDALVWHKWSGILTSLITFSWYTFREYIRNKKTSLVIFSIISFITILITGHLGADITHGKNYILEPIVKEKELPTILFEDAEVFTNMVQPILKTKCVSCHNTKKAKGELVLETVSFLKKGGKSGPLWDLHENDLGLLLRRVHLPLEAKKHMPPIGKSQLSEDELTILNLWIKKGSAFTGKVSQLPPSDTLHLMAKKIFNTVESDEYTFKPASENTIKELLSNYRSITPLSLGSPALGVSFFSVSQFKVDQLKELLKIKEQIVTLNLNKMPVIDQDLSIIAQFINLRKLNLSFTNIQGPGLIALQSLTELRQLSLSGTGINAASLSVLSTLPKLSQVHIWSTPAQSQNLALLQKQLKNTKIETGFNGDTVKIKLNLPIIENEQQVLLEPTLLQLKHYVKDVNIHYSINGKEPDSIVSPVFKGDFLINDTMTIRVKAFKKGWISSDITEMAFYKASYKIDSIWTIQPPDPQYKSIGAPILTDGKKGDRNTRSGKWLGYRGYPMESILLFNEPKSISSITISTLIDTRGYIMPPAQIEIWAGNTSDKLHLIKKITPEQPMKDLPGSLKFFTLSFNPIKEKYFKVVVFPIMKLPRWHNGKGDRGWIFVDEIFVNR